MKWKSGNFVITPPTALLPYRQVEVELNGTACLVAWLPAHNCLQIFDEKGVEQRVRIRALSGQRLSNANEVEVAVELIVGAQAARATKLVLTPDVPGQDARLAKAAASGATVKSQLTGKVLHVLVQEGETVTAGQPLVIIEAMKMENKLLAPMAGTISGMAISQATAISTGALVCKILPSES